MLPTALSAPARAALARKAPLRLVAQRVSDSGVAVPCR